MQKRRLLPDTHLCLQKSHVRGMVVVVHADILNRKAEVKVLPKSSGLIAGHISCTLFLT